MLVLVCGQLCVCVFLCTCHFQMALSSSFSLNKERCHVLIRLWRPLVGLPPHPFPLPPFPPCFMFQLTCSSGTSLGFTKKGPGQIVDLSSQESTLLFLFNP
uniref:Secreted protein n=1 Tax=Sciurus vulgaris TaxID=55149 RepID=A0A8D2B3F4_SCIVU